MTIKAAVSFGKKRPKQVADWRKRMIRSDDLKSRTRNMLWRLTRRNTLLRRLIRRNNILRRLIRRNIDYRVKELPKFDNFILENKKKESRINLILPTASEKDSFGGIETALRFFEVMSAYYNRSRIIFFEGDVDIDHDTIRWPNRDIESRSPDSPHTVAYLTQRNFRLIVENENDHFIATHWTTANYIKLLREAQPPSRLSPKRPFIYLIQDFEPAFYPWSSRYLLAQSTYNASNTTIAVFNTELLRDYFRAAGYVFPLSYAFEPRLNPVLAEHKKRLPTHQKRRLLLVYGRPGSPRNAFELIVEALFLFTERYNKAAMWEILSLGDRHLDVQLPKGLTLLAEGKVPLEVYAQHLLDAAVGLSLMVSPHPSYPPLEMAEFGVRVITNTFANKNLSNRTHNIVSVTEPTPATLAEALIEACNRFDRGIAAPDSRPAFLGTSDEFPFSKELAERLHSMTE